MYRVSFYLIIVTALAFMLMITRTNSEESPMRQFKSLKVGMVAPDFTLKDGNGIERSLRDYLAMKNVVLAFYPKDFTGG